MEITKAKKKKVKIKVGLQGSAGSGKTYSALKMALGLTGGNIDKIAVIDTENGSAALYTDIFGEFLTIDFKPPYTPERCIEAIDLCLKHNDIDVIIFDSISHEWIGSGGVIDLVDKMTGNSMLKWAKLTPRHNRFIDAILQADKHMICTMRSKQDYVITQNEKGQQVPEKIGMKAVTRDGVDYEFTLNFDIDQANFAKASKDRTSLFKNQPETVITEETGKTILEWCNIGVDVLKMGVDAMNECKSLDELKNVWLSYKDLQSNEIFQKAKESKKVELAPKAD